jgi:hypothetical protein
MKVWMLWVQGDGATWLEAAWDDDMTADNGPGWDAEVERVRKLAYDNKYEMRVQEVEVPGVRALFDIPKATATEPHPRGAS